MRDIRDDLRERLAGLRQERDSLREQLQRKLAEIDAYEERLTELLAFEEQRVGADQPFLQFGLPADAPPPVPEISVSAKDKLESMILVLLQDGEPKPHAFLKEQLERAGFGVGQRNFGRMLHGTLMSMRSREMVDLVGTGTWRRRIPVRADAA